MNAKQAFANNMISKETLREIMQLKAGRLARCGFEDLNPKPDHLLVSFDETGQPVMGWTGRLEGRLCNFELIRRVPNTGDLGKTPGSRR